MPATASRTPTPGADPEDGRAVVLGNVAPLDQGRAERVVGEDDDEAREDEHHRREPPVVRRQQPREDERDDHARELERHLRAGLPGDPAEDPAAERVGRDVRLLAHARAGTAARRIAVVRKPKIRGERARRSARSARVAVRQRQCLGETSGSSTSVTRPACGEAAPELELVVVDRLGERLPARHDDRALAVRERDHHRADTRMGDERPAPADRLDHAVEGEEVDELGVRALESRPSGRAGSAAAPRIR